MSVSILRSILICEYILGGLPRLTSWPLTSLHAKIHRKSQLTAPYLYPVFPFCQQNQIKWHMSYVGALMLLEALLLTLPQTRYSLATLFMNAFLTGAGWWSQMKAGLPYWLPITNFFLGSLIFMMGM